MDTTISNNKTIEELFAYPAEDVETALIREILNSRHINKVKNRLISSIISKNNNSITWIEEFILKNRVKSDINLLEKFYELRVNSEDRKVNGSYYTPEETVGYIVNEVVNKVGSVCDPACGAGAFLIEATKVLKNKTRYEYSKIYSDFIFGVDILPASIQKTKTVLSLLSILDNEDKEEFNFNIFTGDSLTFDWKSKLSNFNGFDFVVGNPPYVRTKNIRKDVLSNIRLWETSRLGNVDLYIPFFEMGISWTNKSGRVGYITPSTYLTSLNARVLRRFLSDGKLVEKIIDFNGWQVFEGALTYTCITILNKPSNDKFSFSLVKDKENIKNLSKIKFNKMSTSNLGDSEWRLLSETDAYNIARIEKIGSPLYKYVRRYITGLATLSNDIFLVEDNDKPYLEKNYNGETYYIERGITVNIIKPNKIKTADSLKKNRERIIYPYEKIDSKIVLLREEKLRKLFPKTHSYLCAVKPELDKRGKGEGRYEEWYAYGRTQGLDAFGEKIIMPMMNNKPAFVMVKDKDTLIYCGYAIYPKNESDSNLLMKILNSDVLWYYLDKTSKNYAGGYKSFAKNYVKNFSIPNLNEEQRTSLLSLTPGETNQYLYSLYGLRNK